MLEWYDRVRGKIAEFVFDDLGIPLELFCIGMAILAIYRHRWQLKAWRDDLGQKRNNKRIKTLSPWEQLEKYEQSYIHTVVFGIVVMLILGFLEMFFGIYSVDT